MLKGVKKTFLKVMQNKCARAFLSPWHVRPFNISIFPLFLSLSHSHKSVCLCGIEKYIARESVPVSGLCRAPLLYFFFCIPFVFFFIIFSFLFLSCFFPVFLLLFLLLFLLFSILFFASCFWTKKKQKQTNFNCVVEPENKPTPV